MEHLQRRGERLYFRLKIPKDVQGWFGGKVELKRSLKTTRYNNAKALVAAESAKAERLFMQIRGGLMTTEEIRRLISAYFERTLQEVEDQRADGIGVLTNEREDGASSLTGLELHLEELTENLARGETQGVAHVAGAISGGSRDHAGEELPRVQEVVPGGAEGRYRRDEDGARPDAGGLQPPGNRSAQHCSDPSAPAQARPQALRSHRRVRSGVRHLRSLEEEEPGGVRRDLQAARRSPASVRGCAGIPPPSRSRTSSG